MHKRIVVKNPLFLAFALAVSLLVAGCGAATTNVASTSNKAAAGSGKKVRALQHLSATSGWLLTEDSLDWASGLEPKTHPITPATIPAREISAAYFVDDQRGWAAAVSQRNANGGQLTVSRTTDGGASWKDSKLKVPAGVSDIAAIDFVDPQHGFLLANVESSSNFSVAELYATADGGVKWNEVSQVGGKAMRFATPSRGFLVAGPQNDQLLVTDDGGQSWQRETIQPPSGYPGVQLTFAVPTFSDAQTGVLPVTFSTSSSPAVAFYSTSNGGSSWTLAANGVRLVPGAIEPGFTLPTTVLGSDAWVVAAPDGHRVYSTATGGSSWRAVAPNGLPSGVTQIDFATPANGWGLVASGSCGQDKTNCTQENEALSTTDGGQTWAVILGP